MCFQINQNITYPFPQCLSFLFIGNPYANFVHPDDLPDASDMNVIDCEAEAIGVKSRYALLCCRRYLYRRLCTILPVSSILHTMIWP